MNCPQAQSSVSLTFLSPMQVKTWSSSSMVCFSAVYPFEYFCIFRPQVDCHCVLLTCDIITDNGKTVMAAQGQGHLEQDDILSKEQESSSESISVP